MVIWSVAEEQVPLTVVVNVKVKLPEAISEALGVYTAFIVVLFGAKDPEPPLQAAPEAMVKPPASVVFALLELTD